ncbi:MAG: glycosyltransferase family 2 protein [Acidobacteria bacterium]|nr:glycosyltransferase family 2 protein [Acidobacteriota bacterium]
MNRLTVTLIACNEEPNLPRVLASVAGLADEIVLVDSGSTDRTCEVARQLGARVVYHPWSGFGEQRNFAAAQAPHDWVLALDADEELSPELRASLRVWKEQPPAAVAYEFARRASYLGRWIWHSGWYPDRKARLYRRDRARFAGVAHDSLEADGHVARLEGDLLHHAFRTFAEHAAKVNSYSTTAAQEMYAEGRRRWRAAMLLAPPWALLQKFILRRGFLDGTRGWKIARMSARYTFLKYRKLGVLLSGGSLTETPGGLKPAATQTHRPEPLKRDA